LNTIHGVAFGGLTFVTFPGVITALTCVTLGNLVAMVPPVKSKERVKDLRHIHSFLKNALISLSSFELSLNCFTKQAFASVKASTTSWCADVAMAQLASATMVTSAISSSVCTTVAFSE
jgi:hypothetical protein